MGPDANQKTTWTVLLQIIHVANQVPVHLIPRHQCFKRSYDSVAPEYPRIGPRIRRFSTEDYGRVTRGP